MPDAASSAVPPAVPHSQAPRARGEMPGRLGAVAVVTGASDGIGRATAAALAAEGFDLVLVARRAAALENLGRTLSGRFGVSCRVVAADLGQRDGQASLSRALAGVDVGVLVAAAGFGTAGPFVSASLDEELDMLEVNCAAVCRVVHDVVPDMVARGRGAIVLLSSVVAFQGVPRAAHYAATKAYVQSFAEGLGAEVSSCGVDVVALAPGPTQSGFAARSRLAMGKAAHPTTWRGGWWRACGGPGGAPFDPDSSPSSSAGRWRSCRGPGARA